MTMRLRTLALALFASLALLAAGCGGGTTSNSSGSGADLGSSQWKQVDALSKKFPGRDMALAQINKELEKNQLDYNRDIKPALGPEVDLAIVLGPNLNDAAVVGLTKPDDAGKFKALVKKLNETDSSGQPAVYREANGWYALSDS